MQPPSIITLQQHSRRLSADLETPISLFLSLTRDQTPGLLLESAEVDGKWGRYSVIACDYLMTVSCADARLSLTVSDERLASLKELDGMPYLDGLRVLMQRLELVGDDKRRPPSRGLCTATSGMRRPPFSSPSWRRPFPPLPRSPAWCWPAP